jgi:hypothetical protein
MLTRKGSQSTDQMTPCMSANNSNVCALVVDACRYSMAGTPPSPTAEAGPGSRRQSLDAGRIHSRSTEAATARRSVDAPRSPHSPSSPRTSFEQVTADERAARALARFNVQVNPRVRGGTQSAGSDAELLARVGSPTRSGFTRSSTLSPDVLPRQPLSPRQHLQRGDDDAQRVLRTLSLLPQRRTNAEMARAWEGFPQQQQPLDGRASTSGGPFTQQEQQPAGGQQMLPAVVKLAGLGYEEGSRIYSDEEVQAVAAALPAPLSLQQQRLLADLLRLKRVSLKCCARSTALHVCW